MHLGDMTAAAVGAGWLLEDQVHVRGVEELADQGALGLAGLRGEFLEVFDVDDVEDDIEAVLLGWQGLSPWGKVVERGSRNACVLGVGWCHGSKDSMWKWKKSREKRRGCGESTSDKRCIVHLGLRGV